MIRKFWFLSLLTLFLQACATQPRDAAERADTVPDTEVAPSTEQTAQQPAKPVDEEVMYSVFAAELLGNEGDLDGAVGAYLEAAMDSDDPAIAMRATRVAFAAQAWQQASMAADRWALLDPDNLAAREAAAMSQLATMDFASAEYQLLEILRLSEDKEKAWNLVARLLGRSPSPEKAMKLLDTLLQESGDKGSAVGVFTQSQLALRSGEPDLAFELAEQAARLAPDRIEFLAWAGQLALNRGNTESALKYIHDAWDLRPEDHDLTLAYADLLARSGDESAARVLMEEMQQTPDVMLSRILFELSAKNPDEAQRLFAEFDAMSFDDPNEKAYFQAQSAEAIGNMKSAVELYGTVGEGEYAIPAISRRAEILAASGDLEGARKSLANLRTQSDPAVIEEAWLTEARILQQSGDRDTAIDVLDQGLQEFPRSMALRYARALVAAENDDVELAESDLRIILTEQPDNAAALNALGYTLADQTDRFEEAEELIRQAFVLQPGDPSITDSLGWVMFRLGRLEEAEIYLRQAWNMEQNPEIGAHLGEVLWAAGRKDEARKMWKQALDVDPDNPALVETLQRLKPGLP